MKGLRDVQERLGCRFDDESLLEQALTHPSVTRDRGVSPRNNQRLEFLGDAVLQLVITSELYSRFPSADEGSLTKARAHLVNRATLSGLADALGLGRGLRLSRGEDATGGRRRTSTLADAFEAVIGALFLDRGLAVAREVVLRQFKTAMGALGTIPYLDNPKGDLQELLQSRSSEPPQYRLESSTGPDHDRRFVVVVYHQGTSLGRGEGRSKKAAESEAARVALTQLRTAESAPSLDSQAAKI